MNLLADPVLVATVAGAYALLFAFAASHKLRAPQQFRSTLDAYRVLPAATHAIVSRLLPVLELLLALALLHPQGRSLAALGAGALLLAYAAVMAQTLWRAHAVADCGCSFGAHAHPVQWSLVGRNLLLALPPLLLALQPANPLRPLSGYDYLTVLLAIAMASVLYALANTLIANHHPQRDYPHD